MGLIKSPFIAQWAESSQWGKLQVKYLVLFAFIHLFIYSFIHSFIYLFKIRSFIYLFVCYLVVTQID